MSDEASVFDIAVDVKKRQILVANSYRPRVSLVPLDGGVARLMPGFTDDEGWVFGVAFSPDGRLAVAAGNKPARLRIWDLASGALRILDTSHARTDICFGDEGSGLDDLAFLDDHSLLTVGNGGIEVWDIERAVKHNIRPCAARGLRDPVLAIDRARRHATVVLDARLTFVDVEHEKFYDIGSHGSRLSSVALDPTGTIVVTGDLDGVVRVGPVTGEAPHLLFGHKREVTSVAVSPDGKWIASGSQDGTIRLWPMPEGTPFHTLPYEEILKRIRSFTNLRVVPDEASETGYRVEVGPFPGWRTLPTW